MPESLPINGLERMLMGFLRGEQCHDKRRHNIWSEERIMDPDIIVSSGERMIVSVRGQPGEKEYRCT